MAGRHRVAAWSLFTVVTGLAGMTLAMRATRTSTIEVDEFNTGGIFSIATIGFALVGALVVHVRGRSTMGWLFVGFAVAVGPADFSLEYAARALEPGADLPFGPLASWVYGFAQAPAAAVLAVMLLCFPSGRPPSARWHVVTAVAASGAAISIPLAAAMWEFRGPRLLVSGTDSTGLGTAGVLLQAQFAVVIVAMGGGVAALAWRLWRSTGEERLQVKWVAAAGAILVLVLGVDGAVIALQGRWESRTLIDIVINLAVLTVPAAAGIGILRHRLFDIDLVIRRSALYGAATLLIGGTYIGLAAIAGVAAGDRAPLSVAVGVTIVAMAAFQPLQRRVREHAARQLLGERLTGQAMLAGIGDTLEHALDPHELAPSIASGVRDALGVEWVRLSLDVSGRASTVDVGDPRDTAPATLDVPLIHAGRRLGTVVCGPKRTGSFTDDDRELIWVACNQIALGLHNAELAAELAARIQQIEHQAADLRESRARLVHAQDDERRRIERDIHDGVQQELVALIASLRLARNQLGRDPATAEATLTETQVAAGRLLDDLRELSQGIHPSVLIDQGLLAAIEARAARLPIGVAIDADPTLRHTRFGQDTEAAAYFIVSEALANVLKHAAASQACLRLGVADGLLRLAVSDDGVGFDPTQRAGSGLTGLRDRTEAVGGTLSVDSAPGRGTSVVAHLPMTVTAPGADQHA